MAQQALQISSTEWNNVGGTLIRIEDANAEHLTLQLREQIGEVRFAEVAPNEALKLTRGRAVTVTSFVDDGKNVVANVVLEGRNVADGFVAAR